MSPFSYLLNPSTPNLLLPLAVILLSIYESVSVLLVIQSVHQLPQMSEIVQTECRLVLPLWKAVWRYLKKLKMDLSLIQQSHFWEYIQRKPKHLI